MLCDIMGVGSTLRQLAAFIEECERADAVDEVSLTECIGQSNADALSTDVELTLSDCSSNGPGLSLCATSINADRTMRFGFETTDSVVPDDGDDIEVEPGEVSLASDGTVQMTLSVSVGTGAAGTTRTAPRDGDGPATSEDDDGVTVETTAPASTETDLPPFKNPELLGEVYESCDTFAEMAETLEMDVTAETVRRYMIDFDIHEPNSYNTGSARNGSGTEDATEPAEGEQTPPVLSDGIGLPEDITVETFIDTVKRSNTIYEVKQELGVDREDALEILRECNLLDLVMGRLATEAERDITRDDVIQRLRSVSEAQ